MYKFMSVVISLVLVLSLSACGGKSASQDGGTNGNVNIDAEKSEISLSSEFSPTGTITVSAYDTMRYKTFLEDAARLFEEKYPGTAVNVETFSVMPEMKSDGRGMIIAAGQNDSQSRADYINKINTALMSRGGADILLMDILPFYKYADSGQLENLAAYIQADSEFNKSDYKENILDAVEYKNGTWFLPIDYTFNYYAYDSALLNSGASADFGIDGKYTAEELIVLAEPYYDGSAKLFNRPDYTGSPRPDMWSLLLEENYNVFVDIENKKANFNDGGFVGLLESVKQYSEQGYITEGQTERKDSEAMMRKAGEEDTDKFFFKPQSAVNLLSLYSRGLGMSMTAMAEGGTMAVGDDDEIAGIEACKHDSVPFAYEQAYAINSNSGNKETAWAFLRFLLSEDIQLNPNLSPTSLPVLNSARQKKAELALTTLMDGQALNNAQLEAVAKYNEAVEKLSGQINAYVIKDTTVDDMIAAEAKYFFDGMKTAAEVADVLQNKVDLYLNE